MSPCNCTSRHGREMVGKLEPGGHGVGSLQATGSGADVHGAIPGGNTGRHPPVVSPGKV
jgi:hypothetical protein